MQLVSPQWQATFQVFLPHYWGREEWTLTQSAVACYNAVMEHVGQEPPSDKWGHQDTLLLLQMHSALGTEEVAQQ